MNEICNRPFVIIVVIGLLLELAHQGARVFVGPVGQHHHIVAVVLERLRLLGIDNQRPIYADLLLKPGVAVIPVGAVLLDLELVDVHPVSFDAVEAEPRHAIHVCWKNYSVPVNGRRFL